MNDFDFLVGSWDVANYRLEQPLAGRDEWEEFPGTSKCIPMFDHAANIDEIHFPTRAFSGISLRLFDPQRQLWTIHWASSRDGRLQPAVGGRFVDGRGEFYGDDSYEGTPVRVRYIWSDITASSARWEQAFSADGETSWETNWIMELTRR